MNNTCIKGWSGYVAGSYAASTSISYFFGNLAFIKDSLEMLDDPNDFNSTVFCASIAGALNLFLFYTNLRVYFNNTEEVLTKKFGDRTHMSERLSILQRDRKNSNYQKCNDAAAFWGSIYKALTMTFSSYLLLKKRLGFYGALPLPLVLMPGIFISQWVFFREDLHKGESTDYRINNRAFFNYVTFSYSFAATGTYALNFLIFIEFLLNLNTPSDAEKLRASTWQIYTMAAAALPLFLSNYRTFYGKVKNFFGYSQTESASGSPQLSTSVDHGESESSCCNLQCVADVGFAILTVIGALYKSGSMGCSGFLLFNGLMNNWKLALIIPGTFLTGNFLSQLGLFNNQPNTTRAPENYKYLYNHSGSVQGAPKETRVITSAFAAHYDPDQEAQEGDRFGNTM